MGILSPLMNTTRCDVQIKVQPWFRDHSFDGRPVLPAVESLLVLAGVARELRSDLNVREMADAGFPRFLEIPARGDQVEAVVELKEEENGTIRAGLCTRIQTSQFSRLVEHATVCFGGKDSRICKGEVCRKFSSHEQPFVVPGKRIYEELVPFGRAYRNTIEADIFSRGAAAKLYTPEYSPEPGVADLGSPFLLDSAFHVACVWGQRFAGFVPFPVGFKYRRIATSSQPGRNYRAEVDVVVGQGKELEFDIDIVDADGGLVEQVRGVRMRDVSGGGINPPDWIQKKVM